VITKKLKRRFHGHTSRINSVACSSGAETFLSASYDGTVRIWDGRSWNKEPIQILSEARDSVSCVRVVSTGGVSEIITGSVDGSVRTYDLRRGQIRCDHLSGDQAVTSLSISPNSLCMAISCLNGMVHLLERTSGRLIKTFSGKHEAGRYAIECDFTADNSYLMCGSENGNAVFYHLATGHREQSLEGHTRPTCSVVCHPNPKLTFLVITASYDGNAVVWSNKAILNN